VVALADLVGREPHAGGEQHHRGRTAQSDRLEADQAAGKDSGADRQPGETCLDRLLRPGRAFDGNGLGHQELGYHDPVVDDGDEAG
jgi:hypothetical protein